jgi:predicted acetyltransferase
MKYVLSYAKKQGSSYMCLTASSPEAVKLYRKMGFDNFGDYECYEFKGFVANN